jgi:hypothetical protein
LGFANNETIKEIGKIIWTDEGRNALIVDDIVKAYSEGRECLVLSERIEHLAMLREQIQGRVDNLFVMTDGIIAH